MAVSRSYSSPATHRCRHEQRIDPPGAGTTPGGSGPAFAASTGPPITSQGSAIRWQYGQAT